MKRYDIEMNGDDMIVEEHADGDWVRFDEAWALNEKLNAALAREHDISDRVSALDALLAQEVLLRLHREQKLAAANALLERCRGMLPFTMQGAELGTDVDAHLANQPTGCGT